MTAKLEQFLTHLEATETRSDLQTLVEAMREIYDVKNVVYHSINSAGDMFAALTYDPRWEPHYRESGYVQHDPVVRGALKQFNPLNWKRLDWSDRNAREVFHEAVDVGIGNQGYSIPIRGPGGEFALFTINDEVSDDSWQTYLKEHARDMLILSHHLHQTASSILTPDNFTGAKDLSPRERDVLAMLASGRSRGQVAEALGISEHTLRVYVDTARAKLGAINTFHAIALAYKRGLIIY